jgi:CheY-like chemotaxis protein
MRVLIIEDDAALGLFLQKGLKLEGHEVDWVGDGVAGLERARLDRPDLLVLDLSLQWRCPVLPVAGFSPREMALVMPVRFVEEFGVVPLRVAGGRLLYLGFEDRLNASVAYAAEQMSGLKVESGLVESAPFRAARESLLAAEAVPAAVKTITDQDAFAVQITAVLEQHQPVASRLVRLHQYYWLRLWLESGTKGEAGLLPRSAEDMMDFIYTTAV